MTKVNLCSKFITVLICTHLLFLLPTPVAFADAGPALPPVTFQFEFQTSTEITINKLSVFACQDTQCLVFTKTGEPNSCWQSGCQLYFSPAYAPFYKIEVEFADKPRTSNVFTQIRLSAIYRVVVRENDLLVSEEFLTSGISNPIYSITFLPALIITLLTEAIIASLFSKKWRVRIRWVNLVNLISLPMVWFVFPALPLPLIWVWVLGEIFAIVFEAVVLHKTNLEGSLSFTQVGILSLVMNVSSILVGIAVPTIVVGIFALSY